MGSWHRLLNFLKYGAYLSNYCNLQLKSLLHLGQNVITFRTLLHLGQNVITFRTLLHFGLFITFRPSTYVIYIFSICEQSCHEGGALSNGTTRTSHETGEMSYFIRDTNRICEQIVTNAAVVCRVQ